MNRHPHLHTEECAELFAAWRRYHGVAEDTTGAFSLDERLSAARERDMFRRQLDALGCDPRALLALDDLALDDLAREDEASDEDDGA